MTLASVVMFCSCGGRKAQIAALTQERDSLANSLIERVATVQEMNDFIGTIASSLDSIKQAEGIYTLTTTPDGVPLQRDEIMENIGLLENVIVRQKEKIAYLEAKYRESRDSASSYRVLIRHLYAQIDAKDAEIKELKAEIDNKNTQLSTLRDRVGRIQRDLDDADQMIFEQNTALKSNERKMNTCYVLCGTKKDLQDMGVLSKGLLSQKVNYSAIDQAVFDKVDRREFQEMTFPTSIKVLSTMPEDSYTIEKTGNVYVLTVTDRTRFWSMTPYLIIQQ